MNNLNNRHHQEAKPVVKEENGAVNHDGVDRAASVKREESNDESNKNHPEMLPTTNGKSSPSNEHSKVESQHNEEPKDPAPNHVSSNHLPASPKENSHQ